MNANTNMDHSADTNNKGKSEDSDSDWNVSDTCCNNSKRDGNKTDDSQMTWDCTTTEGYKALKRNLVYDPIPSKIEEPWNKVKDRKPPPKPTANVM